MQVDRIAALLAPFLGSANDHRLTATDLSSISTYIDILQRWNARINLTAIRNEEDVVTRHFGESLFAARHLFPGRKHLRIAAEACSERSRRGCPAERTSVEERTLGGKSALYFDDRKHNRKHNRGRAALQGRESKQEAKGALAPAVANDQRPRTDDAVGVADIGSGAGFPGIPIKLWAPEIALTLIESNYKKAAFLKEVTRSLTLTNINIQNNRAESLPEASFDVVTLRAVERFESILPVAARLVAPKGRLALLIGQAQFPPAQSALAALDWSDPIPVPASQSRVLAIACKP